MNHEQVLASFDETPEFTVEMRSDMSFDFRGITYNFYDIVKATLITQGSHQRLAFYGPNHSFMDVILDKERTVSNPHANILNIYSEKFDHSEFFESMRNK